MKRWAIRFKGTNDYLPHHTKSGRGYSHDEPISFDEGYGPRLFHSRKAATIALRAWLSGVFKKDFSYDHYGNEEFDRLTVVSMPHRKAENMEIVEFDLVEVSR